MESSAPTQRVLLPGGKMAEFPGTMSQGDIEKAVRKYMGVPEPEVPRGEGDKVKSPTTPESIAGSVLNPGQPKPPDLVQSIGNTVLPPLITAPTIAAGGELIPAAPAIGRAVTSGLLGGAKAAGEGKSAGGIAWDAVVDALIGGTTELGAKAVGAMKIPKLGWSTSLADKAGKVAGAAEGRAGAGVVNKKAAEEALKQLPPGLTVNVPALGPRPMTVKIAVERLNRLDDPAYGTARAQLVQALNAADKAMLGPASNPTSTLAGRIFNRISPKERFTYKGTPMERRLGSEGASALATGAKAGAQAEGTAEAIPGVPNAAIPALSLPDHWGFGKLAEFARPKL